MQRFRLPLLITDLPQEPYIRDGDASIHLVSFIPTRYTVIGLLKFKRIRDAIRHLNKHVGPLVSRRQVLLKRGKCCSTPKGLVQQQFTLAVAVAFWLVIEGIAVGKVDMRTMMDT